jgi:hypothetical protein
MSWLVRVCPCPDMIQQIAYPGASLRPIAVLRAWDGQHPLVFNQPAQRDLDPHQPLAKRQWSLSDAHGWLMCSQRAGTDHRYTSVE